ncbi:MAG: SDR family NAD(P)-dependent oxidoreductase [Spirochaetes bacterium]|nr:SDR family NAD(P)-dependent oxidoreductase [Spirochaetota bacterium]
MSWLELKGKSVIVTGGAMGIGLALCEALAAAGANVAVADMNEEIGKKAVGDLKDRFGGGIIGVLNIHGATSSAINEYLTAMDFTVTGKINGGALVTHRFSLDDFNKVAKTQADHSTGALKVIIIP